MPIDPNWLLPLPFNLPTVANPTVSASSQSAIRLPLSFNLPALPVATKLVFTTQPGGGQAGLAFPIQPIVQAQNVSSLLDPTYTGLVTLTGVGCTLIGTTTVACVGGVATFTNIGVAGGTANGSYTIIATATGLTSATSSSFTVATPVATSLAFHTQPAGAVSGTNFTAQPVVYILDQFGGVFSSTANVTLAIKAATGTAGATLAGTPTRAASGGIAPFSGLQLDKYGTGYQLHATSAGLTAADSTAFTNRPVYQLLDFVKGATATQTNPITSPHTGIYGTTTITDSESLFSIVNGRARGGPSSGAGTPVWGGQRFVGNSITRSAGRMYAALFTDQDHSSLWAFLLATGATTGDPSTAGFGLMSGGSNDLTIITPTGTVTLDTGFPSLKTSTYLIVLVLKSGGGGTALISSFGADTNYPDGIGIPQYPSARVLWDDQTWNTATLYPTMEYLNLASYSPGAGANGHALEGMRVFDVTNASPSWQVDNGIALASDRFNRTSNTSLGTSSGGQTWTADAGTWGTNGTQAYLVTSSGGVDVAWMPAASDGLLQVTITTGSNPAAGIYIVMRRAGSGQYITFTNTDNANMMALYSRNGGFSLIDQTGAYSWVANTTYVVTILMKGNTYIVRRDGVQVMSTTDAGNNFLTGTGVGISADTTATTAPKWDNFVFMPLTVTLPAEMGDAPIPLINTVGSTIHSDSFAGSAGVTLPVHNAAWSTPNGTWVRDGSGHAYCSVKDGIQVFNLALEDAGTPDVECSVDITVTNPDQVVRAGIAVRYDPGTGSGANFIELRLFKDPSQVNADEAEMGEFTNGSGVVVRKSQLGNAWTAGSTHTMKIQCKGDVLEAWIDGNAIESYLMPATLTGTQFGIYVDLADGTGSGQGPSVFSNWSLKALA